MMLTVTVLSSTRGGASLFSCERGLAPADCSDCPSSTVCFAEWVRSDTSRDADERTPVGSAGPDALSPDLGGGEPGGGRHVVWVGGDRKACERMGMRSASTLQDALEMVSGIVGRDPSITYLHNPPHLITDVT
jgi:hypothetical protein